MPTLGQVIEGDVLANRLDCGLMNPQILWNDSDSYAGVFLPNPRVIYAEVSDFNPMGERNPADLLYLGENPFCTDGSQVLVDLRRHNYTQRRVYYEEGDVQGLVFAVDCIENGGKMGASDYWDVIFSWVDEIISDQSSVWKTLGPSAVKKYAELGLVTGVRVE